jgi:small subunit ribosomal protein S9
MEKKTTTSAKTSSKKSTKYFESVGRRKAASARVRLHKSGRSDWEINDKKASDYFPGARFLKVIETPLNGATTSDKFKVTIKVSGSGHTAQAEAIRLGVARALLKYSPDDRTRLKKAGLLTRDSRIVERKKFGLKKARRAPQWTKR